MHNTCMNRNSLWNVKEAIFKRLHPGKDENYRYSEQIGGCQGSVDYIGAQEDYSGNGTVLLYLDCRSGYTIICFCQNL